MRHMKPRPHTTPVCPCRVMAKIAIAAWIAAGAGAAQSAETVTLEQLLQRAGAYVLGFATHFSNVVTEEQYIQAWTDPRNSLRSSRTAGLTTGGTQPSIHRRELKSDFLLVKLADADEWLPFRDVFEVDKRAVRDRED